MPNTPTMPPMPFFREASASEVPVGAVLAFAGMPSAQDPDRLALEAWGWMVCDGRRLEAHQYPELFAVLGDTYGGDGEHFMIPDLRGCALGAPQENRPATVALNYIIKFRFGLRLMPR